MHINDPTISQELTQFKERVYSAGHKDGYRKARVERAERDVFFFAVGVAVAAVVLLVGSFLSRMFS